MAIERARRLRFCSSVRTMRSGLSSSMSSPELSRRRMAAEAAHHAFDQKDGEENEEIKNREAEQPLGVLGRAEAGALAPEAPGQYHHRAPGEQRGHAVDRIRVAQEPRRRADRDQRKRV